VLARGCFSQAEATLDAEQARGAAASSTEILFQQLTEEFDDNSITTVAVAPAPAPSPRGIEDHDDDSDSGDDLNALPAAFGEALLGSPRR
jgi:hypothetical protein